MQTRKFHPDALRALVERGGGRFRQNDRSYRLTCPRCGKPKLYVQKSDGRSKCMKCGDDFKGWADHILAEVFSMEQRELAALLYEGVATGAGVFWSDALVDHFDEWVDPDEVVLDVIDPLPPRMWWDPDCYELDHRHGARGLAYLESRGIPLDVAKRYGIRYNVREKRVCFPVIVDGVLRGWQGRYIESTKKLVEETGEFIEIPKILTVGQVGGRVLMFQDRLRGSEHGILVEGPVDGIKCDLCGGNTATMGKSFTAEQARIFLRSGVRRLYVGLDDDAAERIMQVADNLSSDIELYRLATPPGREDLGASEPEEVLEEFRTARPLRAGQVFHYFAIGDDYAAF